MMTLRRSPRPWLALFMGMALALSPTLVALAGSAPRHPMAPVLPGPGRTPAVSHLGAAYGHLPLSFEANRGQAPSHVRFLAHGPGYTLFLTGSGAVFVFRRDTSRHVTPAMRPIERLGILAGHPKQAVVRMELVGGNPEARIDATQRLPGIVNYFIGNDPATWHTRIPTYAQAIQREVYPGIDLLYQGISGRLEYAFALAPGRSPQAIHLRFTGAQGIATDAQGNLVLRTAIGPVTEGRPVVYQVIDGRRHLVGSRYVLTHGEVGFAVGVHDTSLPLVIDPTLLYATYLGGTGTDEGHDIAVDGSGDVFVTGSTTSGDFPTTPVAYQTSHALGAGTDAFVSELNSTGTALLSSTYLGGSDDDSGISIAVDGSGDAFVTGQTESTDFPTTSGALQTTNHGDMAAFVTELSASGTGLVYSTYLGGNSDNSGDGIAIDGSGDAFVTGYTNASDFPHTSGAYQTTNRGINQSAYQAFITELNATGKALVYSTYLGGSGDDFGSGIAIDGSGDAFVAGWTHSDNFPTTSGAYQTTFAGGNGANTDAFVTELNASGKALIYSTYLGGSADDYGYAIALDSSGDAFVTGTTASTDFPHTSGAYQTTNLGGFNAFITKLKADGSGLLYSTYLGGGGSADPEVDGTAIAVDSSGDAYVTGTCTFSDFPTSPSVQGATGGGVDDAFITELKADGSGLVYSALLGGTWHDYGDGIALDGSGDVYISGTTQSTDFPHTSGVYQTANRGTSNAFVAKVGPVYQITLDETGLPTTVPHHATFDGATVSLPYNTLVSDGSTHTYSFPSPVPAPTAGTRYVTADPGGTITHVFSDTAAYTTQHLLSVDESGLPSGLTWHVTVNGTSYPGPLSLWLTHGTGLSMSADPLLLSSGTLYFFQGFSPGVPATLTAPFAITAVYLTMAQILGNAHLPGSYNDQWNGVQTDISAGKYADALGDIKAFVNHVTADSQVPLAEQKVLVLDAMLVYYQQICPALAAGQISKTTAANDYAYYKATVTSFGGTPLPQAC
jgi:hypothetical protein